MELNLDYFLLKSSLLTIIILSCTKAQEIESFSSPCETSDPDTGKIAYQACLTEAQQLLRSRQVQKQVHVTPEDHTCGDPPAQYCRLEFSNADCSQICNASDPNQSHTPEMAIDTAIDTWWQTVSWLDYPDPLHTTYTVSFRKLYQLTNDIVIIFNSGRPRQMVLERSVDNGLTWEPWQYYAKDCQSAYGIPASLGIDGNSQAVICSQLYSDILPYSGGQVVFDVIARYQEYLGEGLNDLTLLYESFNSTRWQTFLTFTDVRIRLLHPATDGEENNGGFNLFRYYYTISDLQITAECSCNLHASTCNLVSEQTVCDCQHNTAGVNCESCLPLYNNKEWRPGFYLPAGDEPANECEKCECYEHADSCIYNNTLGHGVCVDCRDNTLGVSCDLCRYGYYVNSTLPLNSSDICIDCSCELAGTLQSDTGCDVEGRCNCERYASGDKCDHCVSGFYGLYDFDQCQPCGCSKYGVVADSICDESSGQCLCKNTTQSRTCNQCKENYYNMPQQFDQECLECACLPAASLNASCDQITGQCSCLSNLGGRMCDDVMAGFYVPSPLTVFTEVSSSCRRRYEAETTDSSFSGSHLLECGEGDSTMYSVSVLHHPSVDTRGYLVGVRYRDVQENTTLTLILTSMDEQCGHSTGTQLNVTIPAMEGWNSILYNDSFSLSIGCVYNISLLNTDSIHVTIDSLYVASDWSQLNYATQSDTTYDYKQCYDWLIGRYDNVECERVVLSSMTEIYAEVKACDCDEVGSIPDTNCNVYGGQCQCLPGVKGQRCDQCMAGYHSLSTTGCQKCDCDLTGSEHSVCDMDTGQCVCQTLVATHADMDVYGNFGDMRCEQCSYGSYNMTSEGCTSCSCDSVGRWTEQCNIHTGECECKSGVGGASCEMCLDGYYNMTSQGCRPCECDEGGSGSYICDQISGQCLCKDNTAGSTCSECQPDTFDLRDENTVGCAPCFCSGHGVGQCHYATGYMENEFNLDGLTDIDDSISFNSLLPSYGRVMKMFVMSPTNAKSHDDKVVSLGNGTMISHRLGQPLSPGVRVEIGVVLTENKWYTENGGALTRLQFQHILHSAPVLHLQPDLIYTSLSVNLAVSQTADPVTQSSTAHISTSVENCTCSSNTNTQGLSCELCNSGYKREDPSLGSLSVCVPCECNGRTVGDPQCDPLTGDCMNCRIGTSGSDCASCDSHVTGSDCNQCDEGFWGIYTTGRCISCDCDLIGSLNASCDLQTGQCDCRQNVAGVKCNSCVLNHHKLTENGCLECSDCYSLVGDKSKELQYIASDLTEMRTQASALQRGVSSSNRTFSQSLELITSHLTLLTAELLSISQQESNITTTLSAKSYLLTESTQSQTSTESELVKLNHTLQSVLSGLGEYEMLTDWILSSVDNSSLTQEDYTRQLSNISVSIIGSKLSRLDELTGIAANLTERLQLDSENLTIIYGQIESVESNVSHTESSLVELLQILQSAQQNTSLNIVRSAATEQQVDIQLNSFNRTISDMIDLSSVINQSLSKMLMDEPIREQASLNQTSTELHSTSERMYITVNNSYVNVTQYLQQSTDGVDLLTKLHNRSDTLRVNTLHHMRTIQNLHNRLLNSLQNIANDENYVQQLVYVLDDFTSQMSATENSILTSLSDLSVVRERAVSLLNTTQSVMNRTARAQRLSSQAYIQSSDLYTQALSQLQVVKDMNESIHKLSESVDAIPVSEYTDRLMSVVDELIAIHNSTCVISQAELGVIKNRYSLITTEIDSQRQTANQIVSQSNSIEDILSDLEGYDHHGVTSLAAELRGLTEQSEGLDLSSFIREVSSRIESQKQSIQNTQTTLHGIQRDLNQITNNV